MTENHGYETPKRGRQDWHVPLNENFAKLDTHVEIRDAEANRAEYDPRTGAKFLATDTGRVYAGTGTNWEPMGVIPTEEDLPSGRRNPVASRGNVQSLLDEHGGPKEFATRNYATVRLQAGTVYEPTETWTVSRNTILDFNGAMVQPRHDDDVIRINPRTKLLMPFIDGRTTGWDGAAAIRADTKDGRFTGTSNVQIWDARIMNAPGSGHGIVLHDSSGEGIGGGVVITGLINGADRAIKLIADGDDASFVNGVRAEVKLSSYVVGIEHEVAGGAAANGNYFWVDAQPNEEFSEWLWAFEGPTQKNFMLGPVWDTHNYVDETVWYLDESDSWNNVLFDTLHMLGDWQVTDESTNGQNGVARLAEGLVQRTPGP